MAKTQLAERVAVGLSLEEADACVELGRYIDVLVFHGKNTDEGGIVSGDVGDVGILPVAELRVAIASNLGLGLKMGGRTG